MSGSQPIVPEAALDSSNHKNLMYLNNGMTRLVKAVQDLSLARTTEDIREIVRHAARELTGADGATFVLRDGDKCHYVDEDAISPLWKGLRFPMETCISGWAMHHGQPVVIPDIYVDPRIPVDAYRPTFVKSLVMVPIRKPDPLGAIGNYWASHHEASPEEVELLQALAETTAVAMENVRVYTELEHRIQDRTRQLEMTNKELEAFSYSVSHDLRTPLRHIQGFADLLESDSGCKLDHPCAEYLENIKVASVHMERLIEGLLSFSRVSRHQLQRSSVDMNALVERLIAGLSPEIGRRSITWTIDPLPALIGDELMLSAAFQNLLSNAVKFTAKQSKAQIEMGVASGNPNEWTIFVRDDGAGFDPAYSHKLFGVFQRLHHESEFEGTGVGLANVQRIIQRHGGRVWAEGSLGTGATFYVAFPKEESPCP